MGRIKSALIKRTTKAMINEPNQFTDKFEDNKVLLGNSMPSKSLKNKIAGYISRLKRAEKTKALTAENTAI